MYGIHVRSMAQLQLLVSRIATHRRFQPRYVQNRSTGPRLEAITTLFDSVRLGFQRGCELLFLKIASENVIEPICMLVKIYLLLFLDKVLCLKAAKLYGFQTVVDVWQITKSTSPHISVSKYD